MRVTSSAGKRADAQDRRVADEHQPIGDPLDEVVLGLDALDRIPLVEQDDHRAPSLLGEARDALVLVGQSDERVDDEQRHLRAVDRPHRAHEAVVLDVLLDLGGATDTGGVDEPVRAAFALDQRVDRVARRARDLAHDGALGACELVQQRRLAGVRPADDRDVDDVLVDLGLDVGQDGDDLVEDVAGPVTVRRRDGPRLAEAEVPELEALVLATRGVHLVHRKEDRPVRALQHARDSLVFGGEARLAVHEKDDRIGFLGGDEGLRLDGCLELVDRAGLDATGVDEQEVLPVPVGAMIRPVARDTASLVDDGLGLLCYSVHERRLAHVGPADNCDDGQRHVAHLLFGRVTGG